MLSAIETHAALLDVQHGTPLPEDVLAYFVARGLVVTVDAQTGQAVDPASPDAAVHLTQDGKRCLLRHCT